MEKEFKQLLTGVQQKPSLVSLFKMMFQDAYEIHQNGVQDRINAFNQESITLEKTIANIIERTLETSNQTMIAAYQKK